MNPGKLRLGEPYIPGRPFALPVIPPSGFEWQGAGSPGDQGAVGPYRDSVGFCRFRTDNFEKKTFMNHKYIPVHGVDGAWYWLGPVRLTLYAHMSLSNGAEMAVTTDFQERWDVINSNYWECAGGGRAGFGKAFIRASFSFGGWADIWFYQATMGAHINFMSVDAGFTGELLQEGFGKEAVVGMNAMNGYIEGVIYVRRFRCWWYCCHHCCWWGCWCCCWYVYQRSCQVCACMHARMHIFLRLGMYLYT